MAGISHNFFLSSSINSLWCFKLVHDQLFSNTLIPRTYILGSYDASDVIRIGVNKERDFPARREVKIGEEWFQDNVFDQNSVNSTYETLTKKLRNDRAMTVQGRGRHLLLNWRQVIAIVISIVPAVQFAMRESVKNEMRRNQELKVRREKDLSLLLQNLSM